MDTDNGTIDQLEGSLPSRIIERSDGETVTSVKELLIEAWRNRWSEIEFGINVKKVLPRGVSGDVYDLADVILQQSLIGPCPNTVILSYLVHCINGRIVSYGAVIEAIASVDDFNRHECIHCLLDLINSFVPRIGCSGSEEECIRLARSIVRLASWLLQLLKHFSLQLIDARNQPLPSQSQYPGQSTNAQFLSSGNNQKILYVIEKAADMVSVIAGSPFLVCLLNIGRCDDGKGYKAMVQTFADFKELDTRHSLLSSSFFGLSNVSLDSLTTVSNFIDRVDLNDEKVSKLACKQLQTSRDCNLIPLFTSPNNGFAGLNCIIAFNAILDPVNDISRVAIQIFNLAKLYSITAADLYCEIVRSCFIGLIDSGENVTLTGPSSREELRWAAFTFLKAPQLLSRLHDMFKSSTRADGDLYHDIDRGLDKLVNLTPLLDLADCRSNCDCLQLFLNELCKTDLLTETKMSKLIQIRSKETVKSTGLVKNDSASTNQAGSSLILRAEPTVASILRTLDADYSKNQEGLLGVLCHMVPGKSFELILNAAAANGKLESFTTKLLLFNEFNKNTDNEATGGKASHTRALLFDVTFLMLCHLVQNYGVEIVTKNRSPGDQAVDSFFVSWAAQCLPKKGQNCSPDGIIGKSDPNVVQALLKQFTSEESDFKTSSVQWHEVCTNVPAAVKEVLNVWEQDAIDDAKLRSIVDNVKSRMCCLPIVTSAWLCSYINTLPLDERTKSLDLLEQFMTPLALDHKSLTTPVSGDGAEPLPMFYKERSTLMAAIIKKMATDSRINPTDEKPKSVHGLALEESFAKILGENFTVAHSRSWLDLKCVQDMNTLLAVGGANLFVDSLVRQLLALENQDELQRAVGLIFGLFHLDLRSCAVTLVENVLPHYLLSMDKQDMLVEPKASALARLALITIFATIADGYANDQSIKKSSKRADSDAVTIKPDPDAIQRSEYQSIKPSLMSLFESCPYYIRRQQNSDQEDLLSADPVIKAVANFMLLIHSVINNPEIDSRTLFPGTFLEQLILVGKEESKKIVQFMPIELPLSLIRMWPESISFEYLMALSDLSTSKSRKATAKNLCQLLRAKKLSRVPA